MNRLLALLGLCRHKNITFPQTPPKRGRRISAASITGKYVVCLDCGSELPYDWEEMRVLTPSRAKRYQALNLERSAL